MTPDEVSAIVWAHEERLRKLLQIIDWEIFYQFKDYIKPPKGCSDLQTRGDVEVDVAYKAAYVRFNCPSMKTEAEVLNTLRHELIHVATWPIFAYRDMSLALVSGKAARKALRESFRFNVENLRLHWEKVLDFGLDYLPTPNEPSAVP